MLLGDEFDSFLIEKQKIEQGEGRKKVTANNYDVQIAIQGVGRWILPGDLYKKRQLPR